MKKFLEDLEKELLKLKINKIDIAEILADHDEMIKEAQNEGLTDDEITNKFGDPSNLAKDLAKDTSKTTINNDDYVKKMGSGDTKGYELFKSIPVLDPVKEVDINVVSEDIKYYPHELESIDVYFKNIDDPKKYTVKLQDGVFSLKRDSMKLKFRVFNNNNEQIIIKVPKDLVLNNLTLRIVSSDVSISGVETKKATIKTTSGDVDMEGIKVGDGALNTVSGDFELNNFKADSLNLSSVSGDVELTNGHITGEFVMQTVSGDYEVTNVESGEATLQSVSGDLEGKEFYPTKLNLKSVSGDVDISNEDKEKKIEIGRKRTLSGDIKIN